MVANGDVTSLHHLAKGIQGKLWLLLSFQDMQVTKEEAEVPWGSRRDPARFCWDAELQQELRGGGSGKKVQCVWKHKDISRKGRCVHVCEQGQTGVVVAVREQETAMHAKEKRWWWAGYFKFD